MATTDSAPKRRAHVVLPAELVSRIDERVGRRGRSRFIEEAITGALVRQRLKAALREMEGSLSAHDIPGWETPESASAWVRALRRGDENDQKIHPEHRTERAG